MNVASFRQVAIPILLIVGLCLALSAIWKVPYIFTVIALSGWAFIGHLVTVDDDLPGGWSNPDGKVPAPWCHLALKGIAFSTLCFLAIQFPALRSFGGAP